MKNTKSAAVSIALPLPSRSAPIILVGVMALSLCAALVVSQFVSVVPGL